jgi:fatty acid desaturase
MHHIGHGGYNKIANIPKRYHSKVYALGWRRYLDWFDWIKADAWNYEHNYLHHYFTGEDKDPDLVEENLSWLAQMNQPKPIKLLILLFFAFTWKFTYYSAQTLNVRKGSNKITFANFFNLNHPAQRTMWLELFIPYILVHFVLLPSFFEWLANGFGVSYVMARLAAEFLHNFHTFFIIVPNHCGDDIYRYQDVARNERGGDAFYLRQIKGSANFYTGSEWIDLSQMYLNYQIEHHLFPALPMRQYRLIQPEIKRLCHEYEVPYVQESVWQRSWKMIDIATGKRKMLVE